MEIPFTFKLIIGATALLILWMILKYSFMFIIVSIGKQIENRKIQDEIFDIKQYLLFNGWSIKYEPSEEYNFLKYPLIFHKKYSKGFITAGQWNTRRYLTVMYLNAKDLLDKKNIVLDYETIRNMERLFELEKKINYKNFKK